MILTGHGNRFLVLEHCQLIKPGITRWSHSELKKLSCHLDDRGDPDRHVYVYTPQDAVADPLFIRSLQNIPFTNEHPCEEDERDSIESMGGVLFGVTYEPPWVRGNLKVFSRSMRAALESGKKGLSLGFDCRFSQADGIHNGVPYEVIQTDMRATHIALVDAGRVPGAEVVWQ